MTTSRSALVLLLAAGFVGAAPLGLAQAPDAGATARRAAFARDVEPVISLVCANCHNQIAGRDVNGFLDPASLASHRDQWEQIVTKLRSHEMPPLDSEFDALSPEHRTAAITFLEREFDRADLAAPADPGRVTSRRLNRTEYANTVRDLLGVDFQVTDEFPADDTGYGFDNIGDVLTVSPLLMQKYLTAAERIAARAVGGDPLPTPAIFSRRSKVRRVGESTIELTEVLAHDAEYVIKVAITGRRGDADPAVTHVISVDGQPVKTSTIPVQISAVNRQGGATQRAVDEVRVFLTGNRHVFRAEFVNDETLKKIPENQRRNAGQNIFPEFIDIAGPYPAAAIPASAATAKPALLCDPAAGKSCVERIFSTLARRAYRRPVTRGEIAQLTRVFDRARAKGYAPRQSLQFAVAAMLVSPHFLFRMERDPGPETVARLSGVELASRLSYFLWSSMPDEELLTLGENRRLLQPAVLEAQVKRMLADPKSLALAENFAGQWLEIRSLDALTRDAQKFPQWTPELRDAMRTETTLFFDAILRENRPISDFIDGKFTFLNAMLAKHYGIEGVDGPDFRRVELATSQRSGVFTQGSVLTVSAYPTRTSVVLRGKFLLDNLFNAPPPPAPADVPALDEAAVGVALPLREQMQAHRSMPICASCHARMDPLGFALENYDAIGRWRTADGKFPVDASGAFPSGRTFAGPDDLKTILLDSMPEFTKGLAERMLTYALGRGVESFDRPVVRGLARQTIADGHRLQSLVHAIVKSVPFQQRRGERKQPVVPVQVARNP